MTDPVRRLLLIKPSSLGDIVHAMPTLAALRARFPHAEVTWLVKRQWAPLVEAIAGVDQVCAVETGLSGWLGRIPDFVRLASIWWSICKGSFRSGAMARLTGCARRIGFANAREGSPLFYTQRSRCRMARCMRSIAICWLRRRSVRIVPRSLVLNLSIVLRIGRRVEAILTRVRSGRLSAMDCDQRFARAGKPNAGLRNILPRRPINSRRRMGCRSCSLEEWLSGRNSRGDGAHADESG